MPTVGYDEWLPLDVIVSVVAGIDLKLNESLLILPHDESVIWVVYFLLHQNGHLRLISSYLLLAFHPGFNHISMIQVEPDIYERALQIVWIIYSDIFVENLIMLNCWTLLEDNALLDI